MELRIEEIISRYIDDLNTGRAQPADIFLSQFPDLPNPTATKLRRMLLTLTVLHRVPSMIEEDVINLTSSLTQTDSVSKLDNLSLPTLAAYSDSPTIGECLSQTLDQNPTTLHRFGIPEEILFRISQDDSSLLAVQAGPEQRMRFAKRYADEDRSLLGRIVGLVTHLSSSSLRSMGKPSSSLAFTRPATKKPDNN